MKILTHPINSDMSLNEVTKLLEKALKEGKIVCTGVTGQPEVLQDSIKKNK